MWFKEPESVQGELESPGWRSSSIFIDGRLANESDWASSSPCPIPPMAVLRSLCWVGKHGKALPQDVATCTLSTLSLSTSLVSWVLSGGVSVSLKPGVSGRFVAGPLGPDDGVQVDTSVDTSMAVSQVCWV